MVKLEQAKNTEALPTRERTSEQLMERGEHAEPSQYNPDRRAGQIRLWRRVCTLNGFGRGGTLVPGNGFGRAAVADGLSGGSFQALGPVTSERRVR